MGCSFSKQDIVSEEKKNTKETKSSSGLKVPVSVSYDFHKVRFADCENFVVYALNNYPKTINGQKLENIIFISGKGMHSEGGSKDKPKPVLKPMILDKCKELGYKPFVDPNNEGQIIVPLK